jgi:hypothetical protein
VAFGCLAGAKISGGVEKTHLGQGG